MRRFRPVSEFLHLQAFVVQTLFLNLELLVKKKENWLQPITGGIRGGRVLSYLVRGDEEEEE